MDYTREISPGIHWVGGNDRRLALFENMFPLPQGVAYNSYLILDDKVALMDTVDAAITRQFFENMDRLLAGRAIDYLVVNHMEPDHGASIEELLRRYPNLKLIATEKAFMLMRQFGFHVDGHELVEVKEGDTCTFGGHTVTFIAAPMVHWPEAMLTFDRANGALFSADAFGSFIALDGKLFNDEVAFDRDWLDEARRYFTNIVGKYGPHVQKLLGKAAGILDQIKFVCPLHGPVWRSDLGYLIDKYDKWSRYAPEEQGVMIAYASMYGNTESAAQVLAAKLVEKGVKNVVVHDVSNTHVSYLISDAFKYSHIVLASVTYNLGIYPVMHDFLMHMKALNMQKRTVGIIENGSWAPKSGSLMKDFLDNQMKQMSILNSEVSMISALNDNNKSEMDNLVDSIIDSMEA